VADLAPGSSFGPFRIERLVGRGPSGAVYRAAPTAGGPPVTLKIFHETLAETVILRFEDDTRRLIGLQAPNILSVASVGREGNRRFLVTEAFDGRSLRDVGPLPAPEGIDVFLKAARALQAAWMRLILHRNLKPENILVSDSREVKVADFGLFQEPTATWSPERRSGQSPGMRDELYSLGMIFREALKDPPPEIEALLTQMTHAKTYERVQMVEDVLSRLEAFLSRAAAPPPPPPPIRPPELVLPPIPEPAPLFPPIETPDLKEARGAVVNALEAIVDRRTLKVEKPARPAFPPIRPVPSPEPAPPPIPEAAPVRRRSALIPVLLTFLVIGTIGSMVVVRFISSINRATARQVRVQRTPEKPANPPPKPAVTDDRLQKDWAQTKEAIRALEAEMRYPDAGDLCDRFIRRHGTQAPSESREVLTELRAWATLVQQAESSRKQTAGRRSLDLLDRGGPARAKDTERLLAKWCEEDWEETTKSVKEELARENPYRARDVLDRFLKLPHQGGAHKQEAETRKLQILAELGYSDVADRTDSLVRADKLPEAIALWEEYLAQPHKGGARREEIEKRLTALRDEARRTIYAGRSTILRLVASADGKRIAFTADRIRVIDVASRAEVWTQSASGQVRSMAFAGESQLVTAYPYLISIHDLEKKADARSIKPASGSITALVVSRDGKQVIAARSDGALATWEGEGEPRVEKDAAPGATAMALRSDGKRIAIAGSRDRSIRVRDLSTGEEKKWSAPVSTGISIAWSPEGTRLASISADTITIWNVAEGKELHALKVPQGAVSCVAFLADGARLASGGTDKSIRLWNLQDGSAAGELTGHSERVTCLTVLPDGRLLSGSGDGTVRIWTP
jgi:serine/threonine protein kinase